MTDSPKPFDVCGPMPGAGITVLEASAGTGKTFTIAALTARLVAEGVPLSDLLVVTFTRMATGELRDRVRERLVSAEDGLGRYLDSSGSSPSGSAHSGDSHSGDSHSGDSHSGDSHSGDSHSGDDVLRFLTDGKREDVEARRTFLSDGLAVFDAATITTTHGFCQLVLTGLGVTGDVTAGATLVEDPRDLVEQVVDDLYVRHALLHNRPPPFSRSTALQVAFLAVGNPDTPLEPGRSDTPSGLLRRLGDAVRSEVAARLRAANSLTYDDLLVRLKTTLNDPERGEAACEQLRRRYKVVLVDEFQDTDPVQWDVVRRAFGTGETVLVLIGDPKQAVYAFRGADVYAYLDAARLASRRFTLGENWRSDKGLLDAYNAVLEPLHLGHPDIPYRAVEAAPAHARPGLEDAPCAAPLRVRLVTKDGHGIRRTYKGHMDKEATVDWVADDLAQDVVDLLGARAELVAFSDSGVEQRRRSVVPADIAVLVRTNHQANVVHSALRAVGVPAVVAGTESVFSTPAAQHWLRLLEALEQPSTRSRVVALALTPWFGSTGEEAAGADDAFWEEIHAKVHSWAEILRGAGVATLFRAVAAQTELPARTLRETGGERELTDLGHISQLLHAEGSVSQLGAPALRAWLSRRLDEPAGDTAEAEARSRRLDSDADAVQVLTVHRAKGLEFPIVYCPYLWYPGFPTRVGNPVVFHDPDDDNTRKLDVGGPDAPAPYDAHRRAHQQEERGEELRHLYVALTRAKHQTVLWWAGVEKSESSALGRLLMSRDEDGNVLTDAKYAPSDKAVRDKLTGLAAKVPGRISIEQCADLTHERWQVATESRPAELSVATLARTLDRRWRRTSYSGITAAAHTDAVGSEPEDSGITDEPELVETDGVWSASSGASSAEVAATKVTAVEERRLRSVDLPLAKMPGGTDVGTFVHGVLERTDFAAPDLVAELRAIVDTQQARYGGAAGATAMIASGLAEAISTPLGALASGASLSGVRRTERLDEMGFELPLAGGDEPVGEVLAQDIAGLFSKHLSGDLLSGYGSRLAEAPLATGLRGYLTGSIDLAFRLEVGDGSPRYFVADYKTNWLAPPGEALTAWHYRPAALDAEMQRRHYPLQAILYLVALHRYLRWRLAGYDPAQNLAGALYLFVRGMVGPATPEVAGEICGVFAWAPPTALVLELSDLLDTGSPAPPAKPSRAGGRRR